MPRRQAVSVSARSAFTAATTSSRASLMWTAPIRSRPVGEGDQRVAARHEQMAGVEQQRHVGVLQEALDLRHALDVGGRVVVEDRLVAALAGDVGGARDAVGERPPARVVERETRRRRARVRDPLRTAGVAQHGPRFARVGGVEQVERLVQAAQIARRAR